MHTFFKKGQKLKVSREEENIKKYLLRTIFTFIHNLGQFTANMP